MKKNNIVGVTYTTAWWGSYLKRTPMYVYNITKTGRITYDKAKNNRNGDSGSKINGKYKG